MKNNQLQRWLLLAFTFSIFYSFGYDKDAFSTYVQKYPNTMAVVLNHKQTISLNVDKNSGELAIYETDYEEILYLEEASKYYTNQSIYTSDFFEDIVDINVTVYNKKGKKIKLTDADFELFDSPPSSWVFHDDDKELVFDFKDLHAGYRTVVEYTKKVKRPEFFDIFHFMKGYPVEYSCVEISYPAGVELKFYEQNLEKCDLKRETLSLKKGREQQSWKMYNVAPYTTEKGSVNAKKYIPHLIAQITSYQTNGEKKELIGTADQLHQFFQEFLLLKDEKSTENETEQVAELVMPMIEGMETDLEKIDTIFNWVQGNIKYIAFEDGINGYVPRACTKVMGDRYGDCKDMGNLLVEMLAVANIEGAHVAWVGTRDIPYQMSEIPSPLTCNHVICVVEKAEGEYYFLDATSSQGGYILPPRSIQSKELLIHNGMDDYTLYKVPEVNADENYLKSVIRYHWDEDDSLRGEGIDLYGGYQRASRTYSLSNLDDEDLYDYVKDLSLGGFNRYTLNDFKIDNLENKNEELSIFYEFSVDNLFIKDGEQLILNPTLFKPRISKYNEIDHTKTRKKSYHRTVDYQYEFEIPEGYEILHLPEGNKYEHELFNFTSDFSIVGNKIISRVKYQYNLLEVPPSLYADWNDFSSAINSATIQNVILQKN